MAKFGPGDLRLPDPEEVEARLLEEIKRAVAELAPGESLLVTRHDPRTHPMHYRFEITKYAAGTILRHGSLPDGPTPPPPGTISSWA